MQMCVFAFSTESLSSWTSNVRVTFSRWFGLVVFVGLRDGWDAAWVSASAGTLSCMPAQLVTHGHARSHAQQGCGVGTRGARWETGMGPLTPHHQAHGDLKKTHPANPCNFPQERPAMPCRTCHGSSGDGGAP